MTLRVHDTRTGALQPFQSLEPGVVKLYTCGPTVYDFAHVGNYRANLFYDLLRRHLEVSGYRVVHVMNLTDVDDKIIRRAAERGLRIEEFTAPYAEAFFEDLEQLRARPATHYPRATRHIPEMVDLIARLLEKGLAYEAEDGVYYRVSAFPPYGELAHLDRSGLRAGARVSQDEYEKESATDFALWKRAQPVDEEVGAVWDAPFGRGRPGWHIECSAMSMRYLGETLDVHAGGIDLLFPHHQNEVAQSEGATGHTFSRYWLHSEHLVDATGGKMSKSLGNIATLREVLDAGHDPAAVRMFLIGAAHYRSKLRLSEDALHAAGEQVRRLRELQDRLRRLGSPPEADDAALVEQASRARVRYREALDDDLNLPQGLGQLFELVREANWALDAGRVGRHGRAELLGALADADAHLDVLTSGGDELDAEVEGLI
ncbi:MAG: cysteine--tRNA ligase, partial [Candidatus Dormibacteraeota bacterium]|nr:cysteine--tRNA ligase [Candidatus Dormibacteraeota bacterium]